MPLYGYECQHCLTTFEVRATFKEKEVGLEPECPQCQSKETKQVLTAGLLIHSSGKAGLPRASLWPQCWPGVLWISAPIQIHIIAAPVACAEGIKDTFWEVAAWAARQLQARFGDDVRVHNFDLFEADCPPIPAEAQLPLVLVAGELVSSGGKISVPRIRRKIESILEKETA